LLVTLHFISIHLHFHKQNEGQGLESYQFSNFNGQENINVLMGLIKDDLGTLTSITLGFHASPLDRDSIGTFCHKFVDGGSVDKNVYGLTSTVYSTLKEKFDSLYRPLSQDFAMTFIGNQDGGAIATMLALEFAEEYRSRNFTVVTINTRPSWDDAYSKRVDRAEKHIHRWRDGYKAKSGTGDSRLEHEIWFVDNTAKCCPEPETIHCKPLRGYLDVGPLFCPVEIH
jgi:hypothetical protein